MFSDVLWYEMFTLVFAVSVWEPAKIMKMNECDDVINACYTFIQHGYVNTFIHGYVNTFK